VELVKDAWYSWTAMSKNTEELYLCLNWLIILADTRRNDLHEMQRYRTKPQSPPQNLIPQSDEPPIPPAGNSNI
jgi:hypothetical protein